MTFNKRRAFHVGGASWLFLCAVGHGAMAQDAATPPSSSTQLPEITVTAPSPIVRRNVTPSRTPARVARAAPGRNTAPAAQPQPAPAAAAPQQGVLPIVTDQFATVTVVPNEEIRRTGGGTLGDLLFSKPGITGSEFAPGASSRPIIRGLDVNRVGIVENGIGGTARLDLGEVPFVPIDPIAPTRSRLSADPRRCVTGRRRSAAWCATNNRIPDAFPHLPAAPFRTYGLPVKAPFADARIARPERRDPHRRQFGRSWR